jgi:hypothetical protein
MKVARKLLRIPLAVIAGLSALAVAGVAAVRQPSRGQIPAPRCSAADPKILERHVRYLSAEIEPRSNTRSLGLAASYIKSELTRPGAEVSIQRYFAGMAPAPAGESGPEQQNIIARFGGTSGPLVVVGAHYDVYGELPGADDNASGVAGLLELGRLLSACPPPGPVELVAYSTEEPPYFGSDQMGSAVHASSLHEAGTEVTAMICLEMIGYFVEEQPASLPLLRFIYPRHGYFAAVVGRMSDRQLVRTVKKCFRGATDLPVYSYTGPTSIGADLSDHRNYWHNGYHAVMITDTAFLRNPNYHTAGDTADTLDYPRMAKVVDGTLSSVLHLSTQSQSH